MTITVHSSITEDRVIELVKDDDYIGLCLSCGEEADQCEPDEEGRICDSCKLAAVTGSETIMIAGLFAGTTTQVKGGE